MKEPHGILLASASPRRAWLMTILGVPFEILPSDIPEEERPGETPSEHVVRLAGEKARAVDGSRQGRVILAADTAVVLEGEILGKPVDGDDARRMLGNLSGRTHRVLTGYAMMGGGFFREGCEESRVTMRRFGPDDIDRYLAVGEYGDKAGAYAVQGKGSGLIERVEGSLSNVIGLPLRPVMGMMREMGFSPAEPGVDRLIPAGAPFTATLL